MAGQEVYSIDESFPDVTGISSLIPLDPSDLSLQRKLLQLTDVNVWGIGRRTTCASIQLGITTALQLDDSNVSMIRKNFDVITERTVRGLNGEFCLALEDAPPPKQRLNCYGPAWR